MPKPKGPYDDDVSEAEEAELNRLMQSNEAPPPDDQAGATTGDGDGDDGEGVSPPPAAPAAAPAAPADGEGDNQGDSPDAELAAFIERHKGKSVEELAQLAFQQQKRAGRAEFDSRKRGEDLQGVLTRIQQARDAKVAELQGKRTAFEEKVKNDPDAALLDAHEQQIKRDEDQARREAEQAEFEARADAAIELASSCIPDFAQRAPAIRSFGQEMGFSADEVGNMVDGRQIVTLHLAQISANLIKAGMMDSAGRFLKLPEPTTKLDGNPPPRQPFNRQPARGANVAPSLDQQLADINNMSDADFDKLKPEELEALLRAAEGE